MPTCLDDPKFDLENHDTPFGPLEDSQELVEMLHVVGWDCSDILHEVTDETESYELSDDEWVYTGTDTRKMAHHTVTWIGDYEVPGLDGSKQVKIGIEYSDTVIHCDETGEPIEQAPGYILFGHAATANGDWVGDITNQTYTNLARAVYDAVKMLTFIRDGVLPSEVSTSRPVRSLIEKLTDTELPETKTID